ncbi:MAG: DUF1294 domain-containing protein [Firmicutes bacterium]|nr:DUF1294 domain-containing protein [Bacillota bacterium]
MKWVQIIFAAYLVVINIFAFFLYRKDKNSAASYGRDRVPEKILLLVAFLFGSLGAMLYMEAGRHKTDADEKKIFAVGIPFAYWAQILMLVFFEQYCKNTVYIVLVALYFVIAIGIGVSWKSTHARENRRRRAGQR